MSVEQWGSRFAGGCPYVNEREARFLNELKKQNAKARENKKSRQEQADKTLEDRLNAGIKQMEIAPEMVEKAPPVRHRKQNVAASRPSARRRST